MYYKKRLPLPDNHTKTPLSAASFSKEGCFCIFVIILPDTSLNFVLDRLIGFRQIGVRLTESGAMKPHASVSGLMLSHDEARYFTVGRIGGDQLADYARRRGLPVELVRKFLGGNL